MLCNGSVQVKVGVVHSSGWGVMAWGPGNKQADKSVRLRSEMGPVKSVSPGIVGSVVPRLWSMYMCECMCVCAHASHV